MRFIRKYPRGVFVVRPGIRPEDSFRTGQPIQLGIRLQWQHAGRGLSPWEIEEALQRFQFKGTAVGENPVRRLSFIDTDLEERLQNWAEIEKRESMEPGTIKRMAEDRLMSSPSYGQDHFLSEQPKAAVPYAKYLDHRKVQGRRTIEHVTSDIVNAISIVGVDPAAVLAYERDNEDQHSAAIVAAVEALSEEPEPTPLMAA